MNESGNNDFIGKKAYEIAYALWRIAATTEEKVFADILRDKAMSLMGFASDENYTRLGGMANTIENIIKFAVDVNCITIGNAAILAREIGNMKSAIAGLPDSDYSAKEMSIADIFLSEKVAGEVIGELPEEMPVGHGSVEVLGESGNKAEMRQAAIIERIRQSGNCRLADIQIILPDVSERTIRYDLETLVQKELVERFGPGGRSVYYRAR